MKKIKQPVNDTIELADEVPIISIHDVNELERDGKV